MSLIPPFAPTSHRRSSACQSSTLARQGKARQVYVIKRGQGKGYSGIKNALFYAPNCNMLYGDGQAD
jgi:NAD(P) transhydrogenase subunit beta